MEIWEKEKSKTQKKDNDNRVVMYQSNDIGGIRARRSGESILQFLSHMGIPHYHSHIP